MEKCASDSPKAACNSKGEKEAEVAKETEKEQSQEEPQQMWCPGEPNI